MRLLPTGLDGLLLVETVRHGDSRGYFRETYRRDVVEAAIGPVDFVQDNESMSADAGTLRGLHFQFPPRAQGKLVRCVSGALFDVAVDIRPQSATFGQHFMAELSAANGLQLWVPPGFAHGFLTTEPMTIVAYKVTDFYDAALDAGIRWDDPALAIRWPLAGDGSPHVSHKDASAPTLEAMRPRLPDDWG